MVSVSRFRTKSLLESSDSKSFSEVWTNLDPNDPDYHPYPSEDYELYSSGGLSECTDENHAHDSTVKKVINGKSKYFGSGPFRLDKTEVTAPIVSLPRSGVASVYQGAYNTRKLMGSAQFFLPQTFAFSESTLTAPEEHAPWNPFWGFFPEFTSYYYRARTDLRPDLPKFKGFREFGELKDVPDQIKQTREFINDIRARIKPGLSKSASYYLAVEFGWLPLLSSIRQFIDLYHNLEKYLTQLLRDDGRDVHRRRYYATHDKTKVSKSNNYVGAGPNNDLPNPHPLLSVNDVPVSWEVDVTHSYAIWAVGTYLYHLPRGTKDLAYLKHLANRLAGFRVTPGQVYDLVPWTWLIDWFTNAGDIIHSMDPGVGEDGAYSDFCLMGEKRTIVNLVASISCSTAKPNPQPFKLSLPCTCVISSKARSVSGPFNFTGNDWSEFSDFQKSILAAIGLTKFPRVFPHLW